MQTMGYFPLGVTTVLATAKDGNGNSANCTFEMNVTESTCKLVHPYVPGLVEALWFSVVEYSLMMLKVPGSLDRNLRHRPQKYHVMCVVHLGKAL